LISLSDQKSIENGPTFQLCLVMVTTGIVKNDAQEATGRAIMKQFNRMHYNALI